MEKEPKNETVSEGARERIDELKLKAVKRLGGIVYNEAMTEFARGLEARRPDARDYRVFHQLIGSTPPEDTHSGDFEGEDSVEAFLGSLEKVRADS